MDAGLILIIAGIFLLLCWSAFFSASETALMASSRARLHGLEKEGNKSAKRVMRLIQHPETFLSTILTGNTLVNTATGALTTGVFLQLFAENGIALATLITSALVLVFAEVLPKTLASRWPEKIALGVSLPMQALVTLFFPVTWAVRKINIGFMRMVGIGDASGNRFGHDDLRGAIGLGLIYGVLRQSEHRMLDSILDLDDLTVEDVMVHRSGIESLDASLPLEDIFRQVARSAHSRLPVWEGSSDNIVGIIHAKDFYRAYYRARDENRKLDIKSIMGPSYFVPKTTSVYDQLKEFRRVRRHMALVVDEYGDLLGLITLEDVLEEIVGEIEDEHDRKQPDFVREADGSVTAVGHFTIREANREFGWGLPEDEAVTLAGLLTETAERIPLVGEEITIGKLVFRVLAKKHQAILRVRVTPIKAA